ncbi:UNVERIFIED_CONTAM: hypothetical protein NCL1_49922 [Trichonephila clavipes]
MLTILLIQELDREVTTVLTTSSPYIVENAVEYSYKERTYKPLQNQSNAIVFFQQRGNIKRKSPQQETKDRTTKKVFDAQPIGTRREGRLNRRWIEDIEKDLLVLSALAGRKLAW